MCRNKRLISRNKRRSFANHNPNNGKYKLIGRYDGSVMERGTARGGIYDNLEEATKKAEYLENKLKYPKMSIIKV